MLTTPSRTEAMIRGLNREGVTVAEILGRTYAFVALERIGGCMVYDVTNPANPVLVDYKNTRSVNGYGGDNGAEGIVYIGAATSPTGAPIVILANEVSSTLSFYEINAPVLDISLSAISARNTGANNLLSWTTASEVHGDIFEIEKSSDGRMFSYEATIPTKGLPSTYSYLDKHAQQGISYYRLRCKHLSGRITYSAIVNAYVQESKITIQAYPNPVIDQLTVMVNGRSGKAKSIDITDINGIIIKRVRLTGQQQKVNLINLPTGMYTLRYLENNSVQFVKITKQ